MCSCFKLSAAPRFPGPLGRMYLDYRPSGGPICCSAFKGRLLYPLCNTGVQTSRCSSCPSQCGFLPFHSCAAGLTHGGPGLSPGLRGFGLGGRRLAPPSCGVGTKGEQVSQASRWPSGLAEVVADGLVCRPPTPSLL